MTPKLQKTAPAFTTIAVVNDEFKEISLSDYKGKYVVLFFYPLDFTFVCPTEIIAFSDRAEEFRKIDCEVLAASCDSQYSHLAWVNTPRNQGGLGKMEIPILADKSGKIAQEYGERKRRLEEEQGPPTSKQTTKTPAERKKESRDRQPQSVLTPDLLTSHDVGDMTGKCQHCNATFWRNEFCKKSCCHKGIYDEDSGIPFRGLFIIDRKQNLRQITVNDLPVGRSVDETLRLVQAFQYTDEHGEVCPANWQPGKKGMKADPLGAAEYFKAVS